MGMLQHLMGKRILKQFAVIEKQRYTLHVTNIKNVQNNIKKDLPYSTNLTKPV